MNDEITDLMKFKTMNPPNLTVNEACLMGSGPSKHHCYKIVGNDNMGEIDIARRYR